MNINELPIELFIKIFENIICIKECDIDFNLNLRLVCKYWNNMINNKFFCELYSKKILFDIKDNINVIYKISYYDYVKILYNNIKNNIQYSKLNNFKFKDQVLILEKYFVTRLYLNIKKIIPIHIENNIYNNLNRDTINFCNIYGFDLSTIPVNYFKNSKCIDNICGCKCSSNYHGLLDYTNHYLSRGIDDKNRFYILLFYKNHNTGRIFYEFLYLIDMISVNNFKQKILTYSGYNNVCYIGNLSYMNDVKCPYFLRRIKNVSYSYLKNLLNFQKCGVVEYDSELDRYFEYETIYSDSDNSDDENNLNNRNNISDVYLYFNKKEIKKNIEYNNYLYDIN